MQGTNKTKGLEHADPPPPPPPPKLVRKKRHTDIHACLLGINYLRVAACVCLAICTDLFVSTSWSLILPYALAVSPPSMTAMKECMSWVHCG